MGAASPRCISSDRRRAVPPGRTATWTSESCSVARPRRPTDLRERRFVEHTLQIAIQAALGVASHIVSDERLGEPRTSRELFDLLERAAWLPPDLAGVLRNMVGLRNVLVRGYADVELAIVRDVVEHRLEDLLQFVRVIRSRFEPAPSRTGQS